MKTLQELDNIVGEDRIDQFATEQFELLGRYTGSKEEALTLVMSLFITGCHSTGLSRNETIGALVTALDEYEGANVTTN